MKINVTNILLGILCILGILGIIFIWTLTKKMSTPSDQYKETIKAYDKVIEAKDQVITLHQQINDQADERIKESERRDSLILSKIISNQPKYKANEKKLQDAASFVNTLTKEQLRREFASH